VALKAALGFVRSGADVFRAGDIAAGVAPSAVNSPEKTTTPMPPVDRKTGISTLSALLVNDPAAWGSPNPNRTLDPRRRGKFDSSSQIGDQVESSNRNDARPLLATLYVPGASVKELGACRSSHR